LTFHIGSDFAAYFGLGGAENDLVYGGWSVGNNRYRILHSGNASYAWNLNQNLRTTDNVTFGNVTGAIFYDSSNTAYYIDPASTSVLNKINLNSAGVAAIQWRAAGVGTIVGGYPFYNNASYGSINIEVSDNDTGGLVIDNEGVTVYGAADNGQLFRTIDEDVYQTNGNNVANATTFWINQGADGGGTIRGSFTATTDFRAPIFYDSDNTAYYINAAGTSVINALSLTTLNNMNAATGVWHTSAEGKGRFYFESNGTTYVKTANNFTFRNNSDSGVFTIDSSGNIRTTTAGDNFASYSLHVGGTGFASSDFRAPIFYDSNNTGYYLDPASTSNINVLAVGSTLTFGSWAVNTFSASVNTSTYWTVVRPNGGAIANGYVYRITLVTTGTGTDTGEQYLLANVDSAGWVIKTVTKTGSGSNWPYVFLDGGVPKVKNDHPSLYSTTILVEEFNTGNTGGLPSAFGLEGLFTSDNGVPKDAQYGFYVASGNVYYKSASGGAHYWRNIANSANVVSFDNSGNIINSGYINASSYIYTSTYFQTGGNLIYPSGYGATQTLQVSNSANNAWIAGISIAPGGLVTMYGDARAPIFYDSDNTTYYGDFASTSKQYQAILFGDSSRYSAVSTTINGTGAGDKLILYGNASNYDARVLVGTDYDFIFKSQGSPSNKGMFRFYSGNSATLALEISATQNTTSTGDFRAPIFYDSNNTAYYLDPSSGSNLYDLTLSGAHNVYLTINPGNGYEAMVRYIGGTGSSWYVGKRTSAQLVGTANFHFYSEAAGATVGGIDTSGNIYSIGSVRSPIFYDSDNTAYYIDAASTSILNTINAKFIGKITASGNGDSNQPFQFSDDYSGWAQIFSTTWTSGNGWGTFWAGNDNPAYYYFGATNPNEYVFVGAGSVKASIDLDNGQSYFATSLRSPIFYDSDNTTYYIDPASTSRIVALWVRGSSETVGNIYVGGTAAGDRLNINYDQIWTPNGNLHLQYSGGGNIDMNFGGGHAFSRTSLRAPIFYDFNNTAFYTDPASTSVLNNIRTATISAANHGLTCVYYGGGATPTNGYLITTNIDYSTFNMPTVIIEGYAYGNSVPINLQIVWYAYNNSWTNLSYTNLGGWDPGTVSIGTNASGKVCLHLSGLIYYGRFNVRCIYDQGNPPLEGWTVTDATTSALTRVTTISKSSIATSITGNSATTTLATKATRANGNFYIDDNYGNTVVGVYSASRYQGVFAMGDSYKLATDGSTTGTLYGIAWSHPNAGGVAANLNTHGALIMENGTFLAALSGSIRSRDDMRTPIYYDSANTSYYIDPASTSVLNAAQITTTYTNNIAKLTNGSPIVINSGLNASLGLRVYYDMSVYNTLNFTDSSWNNFGRIYGNSGNVTIQTTAATTSFVKYDGYSSEGGSFRAPIFYDTDNTAYYVDPASTSNLNGLTVAGGNATIYRDLTINGGTSGNFGNRIIVQGTATTYTLQDTNLRPTVYLTGAYPVLTLNHTITNNANHGPTIQFAFNGLTTGGSTSRQIVVGPNGTGTCLDFGFSGGGYGSNSDYNPHNGIAGYSGVTPMRLFSNGLLLGSTGAYPNNITSTSYALDVRGTGYASSDFRSPVFYDSDDTNFYANPAGESKFNYLRLTNNNALYFTTTGVAELNNEGNSTSVAFRMIKSGSSNADGNNYGVLNLQRTNHTNGATNAGASIFFELKDSGGTIREYAGLSGCKTEAGAAGGRLMFHRYARTEIGYWDADQLFANASMRSPIFYDSNDTTYYIDAASTSQLNQVASYYLRNLAGVSTDHQFGLFFNNSIDTAYAIYREGGAWTNPYPDLRIAFHTGIKLGANAGYNGIRFYNDYTMATQVMSVNNSGDGLGADNVYVNNSLQAGSSLRSPIYYDSDNTGYYINAAGSSVVNSITSNDDYTNGWFRNNVSGYGIYNQITGEHFYSDASDMWNIASANGTQGLRLRTGGYNGTIRGYFYANSSNDVGFLNQDGNWRLRVVGGDYSLADGSSMRAQIFYDSNDTAYYVNPASNSVLNGLFANSYNNLVNDFKDIYVYGDVNTYYVVLIQGEYQYSFGRYSVTRGYNWAGPDTWNNATHRGGLTLDFEWSGDTAWGGNDKAIRIIEFNESYSTMVGGLGYPVNGGVIIWLRGGGVNGALYRIRTPIGCNATVTAYDGVSATNHSTSTSFTAADSTVFSTRANTSNVNNEVNARYPVRGAALLYNENSLVVDTGGNTQTKSGIFASAASVRAPIFYDTDNTGYYVDPNSTSNLVGLTVANTITGSVSGNAVTAGGLAVHSGRNNEANKIVRTDSNGYIQAGWINTTSGDNGTTAIDRVYASSDGYIRYYTPANFRTVLDVPTRAGSGASGSWGISVTGSSASCTGNAATATRTSSQSGYPHAGTGMWAFYNWGGTDGGTSAPSASTYTTGLSVGSNPGDQAYGFQIANNMWNTGLWTRNYNSSFGSWLRLLDSSNYVGYSAFTGNVDGTQFRDANNTAYYVDPASTSNLVGLTVANTITGAVSGNAGSVTINYNNDSNSTYQMLWGSGNNVYGTAGVYLNPSTDYVTATSFNASDWFRSSGATGWYNSTYGGGIYMTDTTWVRVYNSKYFYCDTIIQAGSDMRSPVYYDANDTTYYVDAASTSNLLLVKTRNTFGERVAVSATASTTINTQYNVTELTLAATITTLTLSNIQASGIVHMWTIVTVGGGVGYSITWPAAVKWPGGTAPTLTTASSKRDIYQFVTYDGGTNIYAIIVGQNL